MALEFLLDAFEERYSKSFDIAIGLSHENTSEHIFEMQDCADQELEK